MAKMTIMSSIGSDVEVEAPEDFIGRVLIRCPLSAVDTAGDRLVDSKQISGNGVDPFFEVFIDFEILKGIVAEYIRDQRYAELEDADVEDLIMGLV